MNRRMLVANVVLVVFAIGALVWFERRRSRVTDPSSDAVATGV